jgi:hypothetical protein
MIVIKAPNKMEFSNRSVFLAGSIEMGKAVDWQSEVTNLLTNVDITVLNPRRDDWDSSWRQSKDEPKFVEQVKWELAGLQRADVIIVYFAPGTQSPISLLEFGLYAKSPKVIVICPEGFYRKGNIDIVCEMYDVTQVETLEQAVAIVTNIVSILDNTKYE